MPAETVLRSRCAHYEWVDGWVNPFESSYSLLMKFAWVNCLSMSNLSKMAFTKRPAPRDRTLKPFYQEHRSLINTGWIERSIAVDVLPSALTSTFKQACQDTTLSLFSDHRFRFCPLCLRHSFHSYLFQLDGLKCCPIHKATLQTRCMVCSTETRGYTMSSDSASSPSRGSLPFLCANCGQPLAGSFSPLTFRPTSYQRWRRQHAFQPWHDWLQRLCSKVRYRPTFAHYRSVPSARRHHNLSLTDAHFAIAHQLVPSPISPSVGIQTGFRLQSIPRHNSKTHRLDPIYSRTIAKSIRRYVQRKYLRRHRQCIYFAYQAATMDPFYAVKGCTVLGYVCPIAQAYVRWHLWYVHAGYFHRQWGPDTAKRHANVYEASLKIENPWRFAWEVLIHFHNQAALSSLVEKHIEQCNETCGSSPSQHHEQCRFLSTYISKLIEHPEEAMRSFETFYQSHDNGKPWQEFVLGSDESFATRLANGASATCRYLAQHFYEQQFSWQRAIAKGKRLSFKQYRSINGDHRSGS
jgi:hypothetical protein